LHVTAVGWALTIGVIVALLAVDLILAMLRPHAVGYREAAAWSVFHIVAAVIFGVVLAGQVGWDSASSISPDTSWSEASRSTTSSSS
jgi:hypothetical protein